MIRSSIRIVLAAGLVLAAATAARAGAPQPDTRQGDFAHVCHGGPNKGLACTVAEQASDCPRSACVVQAVSKAIRGTLTLIAHDAVGDWAAGGAGHQALTVLLEVKDPTGTRQLLAATYQNLAEPTEPPAAPSNVVAIAMDEQALGALAPAVDGLLFAQPDGTLAAALQALFATAGTPAIVAVKSRRVESADHRGDALATVLRFQVKIQFLAPL